MMDEKNVNDTAFEDLGDAVEILCTNNEFEADIFISKLRAFGIPAFLSFPGESGAAKTMCGRSNLTIRIMAPSSKAEEAKEILAKTEEEYDFSEAENFAPPEDEMSYFSFLAKGFIYVLGIILLFIILTIVASYN
ncbi:MAG: hypothetical protein IJE10_01605 [Clostridia bacterium]|nr:hypothetical protein [Clostridia bacterium]